VRAERKEVAMVAPIRRIRTASAASSAALGLALSLSGCAGTRAERIELTSSPDAERPTATLVESVASSRADRDDPPRAERWGDRYWGTALPLVRVEPVVAASAWVTVEEWAGEASTRTEVFGVRSEWTLVWRSGNRPVDQPLRIEARRFPGDEVVARISVDGQTPASSLHLNGQGQYYLSISGDGGGWYVAVELPGRDVPPVTVTPER